MAALFSPKNLSDAQLRQVIDLATRELKKRDEGTRTRVLKEFEKIAKKAGMSVEDLIGKPRAPRAAEKGATAPKRVKGVKGKIKYRNPEGLTWTGHGRRPQWVLDFQSSGGDIETLRVGYKPPVSEQPQGGDAGAATE